MTKLSSRFTEALSFATELHSNQKRKTSGVPYITHLLGVASLVLEYGGTEEEAIAALLHDAMEDQGGEKTRQKILERFGEEITIIIDGCSEIYTKPTPSWKIRKEKYINNIYTASPSVRLVSAADKIYNLRSLIKDYRILGEKMWSHFHGGKEGTLWYYDELIKAFSANENTPIIQEFIRVKQQLDQLITDVTHLSVNF